MRRAFPLLLLLLAACEPGANAPNLAIFGTIWTGDSTAPEVRAMAVRGETISAMGDSASIAAMVGANTRILLVGNGMIVPGFADDHVHLTDGGAQLGYVELRDAETPAEFTRRVKAYAQTLKPGEWILGGNWDHERWNGSPLPRKEWIDSVTPDNPVFIQRLDGHMGLANSRALALAKVTAATANITGGTIVRDASGEPTGVLKDEAMNPMFAVIPAATPEQVDSAVARAMRHANSHGLTSIAAVSAPWSEVAAVKRAKANGTLSLRVAFFPALSAWRNVADTMRANGVGDDWIRLAGVKGFVDGSLGSTTALFFQPYLDDSTSSGLLTTPLDSLAHWIGSADSAGLQVVVHAIGDRANALLLDIYDSVAAAHGARDRRFRIEHAQHLRVEDIGRIARTGVIPSMQPYHAADDGRWAWKRIRPEQMAGTYAFRSLLDAKARLNFGSDWPVATLEPLQGIWTAVTRQTLDGKNPQGWLPAQKITVDEALRAYTANNAYGVFAESRRGTLAVGKLADFVMIDRDLRKVPADSIRVARIRTTVVGGKIVY
ncbi:MAG: amidohydrolase [Gemmatimonadota bacterium]